MAALNIAKGVMWWHTRCADNQYVQIHQRKYVRFARTASINQGIKLHCQRTVSVSGWRGADQGWHLDGNQVRGEDRYTSDTPGGEDRYT